MKFTERLQPETQGITLSSAELSVYLLSILNGIANNPSLMKSYKSDDGSRF